MPFKPLTMCLGFALIFFATVSNAQDTDSLLSQSARKWANAKAYALKIAELMPEASYDYKPVPEVMSFKQQLLHIARNIQWLSSSYLFSAKQAAITDSLVKGKADVIQVLNQAYDLAMNAQQKLSPKQLDEVVPFFAGPMSRQQIVLLLHDHQSHHIGQLIVYLRLKGVKPPDYVGW